jgi:hypothetical protein
VFIGQPDRAARSRWFRASGSAAGRAVRVRPEYSAPAWAWLFSAGVARIIFSQIHALGRPYYRFSTWNTGTYKKGARKIPSKRTQNPDKRQFKSTQGPLEISVFYRSLEQRT